VTLARPPEQISGERLLEIGFSLVDEGGVGRQSPLLLRLREAQRHMASEMTLSSMLTIRSAELAQNQAVGP
jgi:hypothetical protein